MNDLVFNTSMLFNTDKDNGCLKQTECDSFYIASYQRGYKWGDEPIKLLFDDLFDASNSSKNSKKDGEYYLQYITVKKVKNHLEIIDGQQRVTTLTILLSIFDCRNLIKNKLNYAVRGKVHEYMQEFIFNENNFDILNNNWSDYIAKYPYYDEQDIYYMYNAQVKFLEKFDEYLKNEDIKDKFKLFVQNNVKLIVNVVEPHISSELIFSNLNNNKVPLSNVDLVKGIFLTKLAREGENSKSFKEILEKRASLGRQWDEMENWLNRRDVKQFYFSKDLSGMEGLLELFIAKNNYTFDRDKKHQYYIFNIIEKKLKNGESVIKMFDDLKQKYNTLYDWYHNFETYNLLGFILHHKGSNEDIKKLKINYKDTKSKIIHELMQIRNKIVTFKDKKIKLFNYKDNPADIHKILFALSVFGMNNKKIKFDFYNFTEEKWSLEHIFPQNPKFKDTKKLTQQDIENINILIDEDYKVNDLIQNNILKLEHDDADYDSIKEAY